MTARQIGAPGPEAAPRASRAGALLALLALPIGGAGQAFLGSGRLGLAAVIWGLAIGVFVLALRHGHADTGLPSPNGDTLPPTVEKGLLALVLLLGVLFLVYHTAAVPSGLNHDAAFEGLYALGILDGLPYTPYTDLAWGRETMTFYFRAVSIGLLGPTPFAVVAPSVVAGILVLPPFFSWARRTFGPRFALQATLLLAVSGWHLVFSSTGWRSDFQPLFMVLTCLFFAIGLETARRLPFAMSGLFLAVTLNTYNGSRVFPLLFAFWLVDAVRASTDPWQALRRLGGGLLTMGAVFGVAVAPLALYARSNWGAFQGRASALLGVVPFGEALRSTLLLFNYRGNGDDFFIDTPGLEAPVAVFFVFGVLWAIRNARDPRARLLVFGLTLQLLPGLLSKPNLNRNVGTMPFVYLLAGLGVLFFARQLDLLRRDGTPTRAGALFMAAVSVTAAAATYRQYIGPSRRPISGYYSEATILGRYLRGLVPDYTILVGGANYPRDSLTYLTYPGDGEPLRKRYLWVEDAAVLEQDRLPVESGKGLAIVLATNGESGAVFERLASKLPVRSTATLRNPAGQEAPFARALLLSKEDVAWAGDSVVGVDALPESLSALRAARWMLREPRGVAAGPGGLVFVCDFGNSRIAELGADLEATRRFGHEGSAPGEFLQPGAITVDREGRLLVADTWNHRVQVLSREGDALRSLTAGLYGPRGIAVDHAGNIFVSDTGNSRIVVFPSSGGPPRTWGREGSGPGELRGPIGIALDDDGRLFVADNGNGRIQIFTTDGRLVGGFPVEGWSATGPSEPHVAIGPLGSVWVTVPAAGEVRAYGRDGGLRHTIHDKSKGPPSGLAIRDGRDLVVSSLDGEISRYPLPGLDGSVERP